MFSGRGGNPIKEITQSLRDLQGARLFDQVFGDIFQELEDEMRGRSPLGRESQRMADEMSLATTAFDALTTSVTRAASALDNPANDNGLAAVSGNTDVATAVRNLIADQKLWSTTPSLPGTGSGDIVVTANISPRSVADMANRMAGAITDPLTGALSDAFGTGFGQMVGGTIQGALAGRFQAGTVGSILGGARGLIDETGILGGKGGVVSGKLGGALKGAGTGTMIAGVGNSLGIGMSGNGAALGGAAGSLLKFIPGGDIIGSLAGGLLGGLFKSNRTANAVITGADTVSVGGKDEGNYGTAEGLGSSVTDGLRKIADAFDAEIGDFMVSIGTRGDEYRVNTRGTSLKTNQGAKSFGDDAEAATRYAIMDAIADGALKGMRASTLRIVQQGKDLDKALQDALDFENAFKELDRIKDPLGSALDDLDRQFNKLIATATTAGASADEWAQLEELYGIKRNEIVKEQAEKLVGSLKGLLDSLTTDNEALSVRDRRTMALAAYDPLKARVAAGDSTAYDDFAQQAQKLLEIERQLYGSQQGYFDRLDEVTKLTRDRIAAETNVTSIAENRDSPFDSAGRVKSSIDDQTSILRSGIDATNINLGTLIRQNEALLTALKAGTGTPRLAYGGNY